MIKKSKVFFALLCLSIGITMAQVSKVTGVVISAEDNEPIMGASILIKGTSLGTITDIDGRYVIHNIPAGAKLLQISYVGMITQEIPISDKEQTTVLSIDSKLIDEVIVVAYGTAKKSSFTGSASVVDEKALEKRTLTNVMSAIEGNAPGVQVTSASGQPGSSPSLRIRGFGSINGSSAPLYVVDGAIYNGAMGDLNPNDIESMTILKDAASTALYASICGLKARVALAMQNYAEAADYADKAIAFSEKKGVKLFTPEQIESCPTTSLFADISTAGEMIWGAMTKDDQTIYFYSFYAYMSWNFNSSAIRQAVKCINSNLYDTMSETDTRRCWWDPTGNAQTPKSSFVKRKYQNRKFTARHTSNAVGDYAFMRLAELYLMKAEALARAEKYAEAQEIFTRFQVTRDPAYVAKGNTGDALIAEIMNSRWVELWGEGFNWLDHKRLGLPVDRSNSNFDETACLVLEVNADDNRWQWAIPEQERNCNPLLEQNPL